MQRTFGEGLPRRLLSLLVALAMVVGLVPGQGLRVALAADPVTYLDFNADGTPAGEKTCGEYTAINDGSAPWGAAGSTTWYVADGEVTIGSRVSVAGDVRLILKDNAVLTCGAGIELAAGNSLTVYAQSEGESMGRLSATGGQYAAGIGGGNKAAGGTVTVNGGSVDATGGDCAAGIGGGYQGAGGTLTVNGGSVDATGGDFAAGIGGGDSGAGGTVTVNGGEVAANGGFLAAGIGGGSRGASGAVTIAGGTVTASGNAGGEAGRDGGAGIGGGEDGDSGAEGNFVSITGGTVTATVPDGTLGAAIGDGGGYGDNRPVHTITFGEGAVITAGAMSDGSGATVVTDAANNLAYKYAKVEFLPKQAIEAADVSATYGETGKAVSALVTEPADGGGAISYAVREGSEGYIDVDASTGALTIKGVPADGKAYVVVTAAGTATHARTTEDVTVTIAKANPAVTAPTARELTYDGKAQALVTAGTAVGGEMRYALGGDEVPEDGWGAAVPSAKDAGDYRVWYKVVGDANYNDAAPACVDARITPKVVGLRWSGTKLTYDGAKQGPKATATGLASGDECSVTVSGAAKAAGTHTATATKLSNPNYALPAKATARFTIAKAKLTVTAKDKKIEQGDAPANAGVTYKGLVGSDTAKSLGGKLSFDYGGYRKCGKAGKYKIAPKGLSSKNYAITYKPGTLTVAKATQKLPASVPAAATARVEGRGWLAVDEGGVCGTTGRSLMLTGLRLRLSDAPLAGSIEYRSHVQGPGWEKAWSADGATSGAAGKRTEAVRIRLTGAMAKQYDVWYRAHVQHIGWMAWAKDGEAAGTAGMSRRAEAVQVVVLRKGSKAPAKDYKGVRQDHAKAFLSK